MYAAFKHVPPTQTPTDALQIKAQSTKFNLSETTIQDFRTAFDLFDKKKRGYITSQDLGEVMRSLGHNPTQQELDDMIRDVDLDGNGRLDFNEFVAMMAKQSMPNREEELKQAFEVFDANKDGYITREELKQAMRRLDEHATDEEVEDMIRHADTNQDGKIDLTEFQKIMSLI